MMATSPPVGHRRATWVRRHVSIVTCAVLVTCAAVVVIAIRSYGPATQSRRPVHYLGVYERAAPLSYAGINQFAQSIGTQPNLVSYYSSWWEPFQAGFVTSAARHGALPLVQINPKGISLAAIASGKYDNYLSGYAAAVRSYRHRVVLSFGHEMNGSWYSWGYKRTPQKTFVAAWRHIVTLFRAQGARNVTWMWTINVIHSSGGIAAPAPWWPGRAYVNWVGIDGYYHKSSWTFAPLFGPTIKAVHALTRDPILIAETGAAPAAGKAAKIANLFAGIRAYGLLGFVWFNVDKSQDWRVNSPAAIQAFRHAARTYQSAAS
jgi:mannan endo-1,4-beta-mannosidase